MINRVFQLRVESDLLRLATAIRIKASPSGNQMEMMSPKTATCQLMTKSESVVDTSAILRSVSGTSHHLEDICKHTLGEGKTMKSEDAPRLWKEGKHLEVADYCLKDCQLVYDIWQHGKDEGFIKSRNAKTGVIDDIEVVW